MSSTSSTSTPIITYDFCDADALPAELTSLSSLEYNRFYKICPGLQQHPNGSGSILPLGQPRCGDNSNYSFFLTRPQTQINGGANEKIIIELSGGGACWDSTTCALQSSQLNYPTLLNPFVGSSCSSVSSVVDSLCSKTIAGIDLNEYNYILIPYCTQDVHLGDSTTEYGVQHVGGHNLYRTLAWIFENYPNPQHIFLTGCSAGATPLPVVYDLINQHYQNVAAQSPSANTTTSSSDSDGVTIDVVADSSVYLTPEYFLNNFISNWNLGTIMEMIEFDYDFYKDQSNFSVAILDHVLDRSKSTDDLAYTFHDADQISQYYYKLMNGTSIDELFDDGSRRLMSSSFSPLGGQGYHPAMHHEITPTTFYRGLNDDDFQSQWWTELNSSIAHAGVGHSNFHVFFMNGTGHCNYGLVREGELYTYIANVLLPNYHHC